jgi:hypothetical protein
VYLSLGQTVGEELTVGIEVQGSEHLSEYSRIETQITRRREAE